jgi:ABC-type Fe3+ transport system substrate-binding protein
MPRKNWVLFSFYLLLCASLFVSTLAFPALRENKLLAYAPVRDLALGAVLPPVEVSILYSTEKDAWLKEVVAKFEAEHHTLDGRPIRLKLKALGSREIYLGVLNGTEKPDLISPAGSLQISILQDQSVGKFGQPVVNLADTTTCRSVLRTPLVLVAWRERADVLWGANPNSHMWTRLHDALVDPKGWETYGHPEWGYIKFGHTNPLKSNSGFMAIMLMTYNYFDKSSGLTSKDVLDAGYQQWFTEMESTISDFGESTGTYMRDMVAYGPSKYDMVAVYESAAIEQADNAVGRYGELRVYYPPATVMSDHPFCILKADWVTPEKQRAARVFMDYLISEPMQQLALLKYGFRPVDSAIPLDQPGSPFNRYAQIGLATALPPEVDVPPGDVLNTLLDFWARNVAK